MLVQHVFAIDRIGIRQGANGGEFYNTATNNTFIFRGNNYYFDPDSYTQSDMKQTLDQFQQYGYNTARIFIRYDGIGNQSGGLSAKYMDGIEDLLRESEKRNIYVFIAFEILPNKGGYYPPGTTIPTWDPATMTINDQNLNWYYMSPLFIEAKKKYVTDFIKELQNRNAPLKAIIGYEIQNEIQFATNQPPFTQTGVVMTAAGPYNMSDENQRKLARAANLVKWSTEVRAAIKGIEQDALVAISPYPPTAIPKLSLPRAIETYWIFMDPEQGGSSIDFVDLHPYPWIGPLAEQMTSYQIASRKKPIVMGEFGADKGHYPTIENAATITRDWQVDSCTYHFSGWMTWIWDKMASETGFYSVIENGGTINKAMAPLYRSDPCKKENSSSSKPGDYNNDTKVDSQDLEVVKTHFGSPYTIFDYNILVENFGK